MSSRLIPASGLIIIGLACGVEPSTGLWRTSMQALFCLFILIAAGESAQTGLSPFRFTVFIFRVGSRHNIPAVVI